MHRESTLSHTDPSSGGPATCQPSCGGDGPNCAVGPTAVQGGIWLRGNPRPGIVIAMLATALLSSIAAGFVIRGVVVAGAGQDGWVPLAVAASLVAGGGVLAAIVTTVTARPRLVLEGDEVRVRLSPFRIETVPLDMVECFFLGSRLEPPGPRDTDSGGHRVRTLVMRIAERAHAHAGRPTLPAWGNWQEGSVTFDGRWCEPLSVELTRRLNRMLAEAKRAARDRKAAPTAGVDR